MIWETRQGLADCVFYWSCQKPFTRDETIQLINWLKSTPVNSSTSLNGATLAILMAFLYAVDATILETAEDVDGKRESCDCRKT